MDYLYEQITIEKNTLRRYAPEIISIPGDISDNLKYNFFEWQREAFENLLAYESEHRKDPTHLMFNMATGTGKTLLMAGIILHYYKQGYRKFIFFVNQNNIVDKTENNFIDITHRKYLFKEKIVIGDKIITIKKVNSFSSNPENIEIKFTTVQKLYNDIHVERENQVLLQDLNNTDIVMLADEAHHLNADTKKIGQGELDLKTELRDTANPLEIEKKGWEHTVIELLLHKNNQKQTNKNILLEFTATIPENQKVIDKYASKTIYKFDLKQFLSAGYTKEINLISSTFEKKDRILQALIFNWYRHAIALKNNIPNFKPIVLFRSKTINDSKNDFNDFLNMIQTLESKDFDFLNDIQGKFNESETLYEQGKSRVLDVIQFIKDEKINITQIVEFIKDYFAERNCIITNSLTNKTKTEKTDQNQNSILNNLEDTNNHIRAIFTVNRLTEGWDVLNLFDIVRLYKGRDEGKSSNHDRKAGSATVSEIQLIGRGVRYYPFQYKDSQKNKRKFDTDLKNELRVLEELFYHSDSDHKYIDELKRELKEQGFINDGKIKKVFKLKENFIKSEFYRKVKVWKNEQIENPNRRKRDLEELKDFNFTFNLHDLGIKEQEIDFESKDSDKERLFIKESELKTIKATVKDFEKNIFYKAINSKAKIDNSLFRFDVLREELDIESIEDFRTGFIGDFEISVISKDKEFKDISQKQKLSILSSFFDHLLSNLKLSINPYHGSNFEPYAFSELFSDAKEKSVYKDEDSQRIEDELKYEDWYVMEQFYGTSEEKSLIEFLRGTIINLQDEYKEVFLLRNEEQYKIFDFSTGQGFQPDFLLFLSGKQKLFYQVFIEPKGDNLLEKDQWKGRFLSEITKKYPRGVLKQENDIYSLIGLPLYNEKQKQDFVDEYNKIIKL